MKQLEHKDTHSRTDRLQQTLYQISSTASYKKSPLVYECFALMKHLGRPDGTAAAAVTVSSLAPPLAPPRIKWFICKDGMVEWSFKLCRL